MLRHGKGIGSIPGIRKRQTYLLAIRLVICQRGDIHHGRRWQRAYRHSDRIAIMSGTLVHAHLKPRLCDGPGVSHRHVIIKKNEFGKQVYIAARHGKSVRRIIHFRGLRIHQRIVILFIQAKRLHLRAGLHT